MSLEPLTPSTPVPGTHAILVLGPRRKSRVLPSTGTRPMCLGLALFSVEPFNWQVWHPLTRTGRKLQVLSYLS
jgi:hypothetical protein